MAVRIRITSTLAAALGAAALLGACGGDDEDDEAAPTKAESIAEADAICR